MSAPPMMNDVCSHVFISIITVSLYLTLERIFEIWQVRAETIYGEPQKKMEEHFPTRSNISWNTNSSNLIAISDLELTLMIIFVIVR